MSNQPERPWSEEEKYTLLTEILKKAKIPSSYLVKMICDFRISPSWADIPLPPGRSLNACQVAFTNMYQNVQPPLTPRPIISHPPPLRHEPTAPAAIESSGVRKRPLTTERPPPLAPRAIKPRPPTSTAPYSREDSAPTIVSPELDERPRKRGRPSKAETERRKAAAEAKGEAYPPPPRRTGSGRSKLPSTPNSPAGTLASVGTSFSPPASAQGPEGFKPEPRYEPPVGRARAPTGFGGDEQRSREMHDRDPRPATRELPRPELRQTLPSPQSLQLGHPRMSTTEPPFEPFPPDRIPRAFDHARQILPDPTSSRRPTTQPPVSAPASSLDTSAKKPPG